MTEATAVRWWELRLLADLYEQSQRLRIMNGERIRAVLLGRDVKGGDEDPIEPEQSEAAERALEAYRRGEPSTHVNDLSVPAFLVRSYNRYWSEERDVERDMLDAVRKHPTWPWIKAVKGIGPVTACKLLSRLEIEKAAHPSSFWSYCGLTTVPGDKYVCADCGRCRAWPVGYNVTGSHQTPAGKKCAGTLVKVAGPEDGIVAARPRAQRGEKRGYDAFAKKTMYLIGTGFLKARGKFADEYYRERTRLDNTKAGWSDGRKHMAALRHVEKLFLSLLHEVWSREAGRPVSKPWIFEHGEHGEAGRITPEEMVG